MSATAGGSNFRPETGAFFQRDRTWHPPAYTPAYKTSVVRSPQKALISLDNTLSEITGPVFGHNILGELDDDMIHNFAKPGESAIGQRIIVYGRVLDERGKGVPGALVEVWQANAGGRYRHKREGYMAPLDPNFGGCGRSADLEMPDRGRHPQPRRDRGADRRSRHAGDDPDGRARLQVRHRAEGAKIEPVREPEGRELSEGLRIVVGWLQADRCNARGPEHDHFY
jgi:hypothetical protein